MRRNNPKDDTNDEKGDENVENGSEEQAEAFLNELFKELEVAVGLEQLVTQDEDY